MGERGASVADHVAEPEETLAKDRSNRDPSRGSDLVTAGLTSRSASLFGLERAGKLPVILTTVGLAALRREGRTGLGVALLGIGGGMAWLGRRSADRPVKHADEPDVASLGKDARPDIDVFGAPQTTPARRSDRLP